MSRRVYSPRLFQHIQLEAFVARTVIRRDGFYLELENLFVALCVWVGEFTCHAEHACTLALRLEPICHRLFARPEEGKI